MEFVYVVPREDLFPESYPHGLALFGEGYVEGDLTRRVLEKGFFVEREYAERTPSLKQVIPYVVVCAGEEILRLRRTSAGGEARLHDKYSIGVGGHINPIDAEDGLETARAVGGDNLLHRATLRELTEELHLSGDYEIHTVGILNDDSNPVGAVHIGLVQVIVTDGEVRIREKEQLEGKLVSPDELRNSREAGADFETWSSLLVDALDRFLPHPTATLT